MASRRVYFQPEALLKKPPTEWTAQELGAAIVGVGSKCKERFTIEFLRAATKEIGENGCKDLLNDDATFEAQNNQFFGTGIPRPIPNARTFIGMYTRLRDNYWSLYKSYLITYTDARGLIENLNLIEFMAAAQFVTERSLPSYYPLVEGKKLDDEQSKEVYFRSWLENFSAPEVETLLEKERNFRSYYRQIVAYNAFTESLGAHNETDVRHFLIDLQPLRDRYDTFKARESIQGLLAATNFKPMDIKKCKVPRAALTALEELLEKNEKPVLGRASDIDGLADLIQI